MRVMNEPHLHLLVNHAPVFASVFAALLLVWALLRRTAEVKRLALAGVVVVGLATLPAYFTGEPAEHAVGHEQGIERKRIHEHEEAGEWALIGASIAGVVALGSLLAFRKKEPKTIVVVIVLLLDLWVVAIFARVANLGGEIRHPEIRAGWTPVPRDSARRP
jgi:hypothetical protein